MLINFVFLNRGGGAKGSGGSLWEEFRNYAASPERMSSLYILTYFVFSKYPYYLMLTG